MLPAEQRPFCGPEDRIDWDEVRCEAAGAPREPLDWYALLLGRADPAGRVLVTEDEVVELQRCLGAHERELPSRSGFDADPDLVGVWLGLVLRLRPEVA